MVDDGWWEEKVGGCWLLEVGNVGGIRNYIRKYDAEEPQQKKWRKMENAKWVTIR
jgi:hypothetical protein